MARRRFGLLCHNRVMLHEDTLTEINELNNYLTGDVFLLTMTDDKGNIHELTNTLDLSVLKVKKKLENWFRAYPKCNRQRS